MLEAKERLDKVVDKILAYKPEKKKLKTKQKINAEKEKPIANGRHDAPTK